MKKVNSLRNHHRHRLQMPSKLTRGNRVGSEVELSELLGAQMELITLFH